MAEDFKQVSLDVLQRQYGYTSVSDLMLKRAAVWDKHIGRFSETFINEILNIDTCISEALDYFWGKKYKISRTFYNENDDLLTLDDDTFRLMIKFRMFGSRWDGAIDSMNEFLGNIFKDRGKAYILDPQDMTVQVFVFNFTLSPEELYLFSTQDILPRPAGVGIKIQQSDSKYFGFNIYESLITLPFTVGYITYDAQPMGIGKFKTYEN